MRCVFSGVPQLATGEVRPAGPNKTCGERSELNHQAAFQPGSSRCIEAMPRAAIERSSAEPKVQGDCSKSG